MFEPLLPPSPIVQNAIGLIPEDYVLIARYMTIQACRTALEAASGDIVLHLPCGLPGFEDQRRFSIAEPEALAPLVRLQSLDREDLCFWAAPVSTVDPAYELEIARDDLLALGLDGRRQPIQNEEVLCLAILSAPEEGALTANLLAPVVVNVRSRVAVQAVRPDRRYSHRHPICAEVMC